MVEAVSNVIRFTKGKLDERQQMKMIDYWVISLLSLNFYVPMQSYNAEYNINLVDGFVSRTLLSLVAMFETSMWSMMI